MVADPGPRQPQGEKEWPWRQCDRCDVLWKPEDSAVRGECWACERSDEVQMRSGGVGGQYGVTIDELYGAARGTLGAAA